MRNIFSYINIYLVFGAAMSMAQGSEVNSSTFEKGVFGLKGGVNISRFSASVNSETRARAGLSLGMYIRKQIDERFFFRPELYYSSQGQKDNYLFPYGGPSVGSTETKMHYINIPILLEVGKKVSFQFGAQMGILIASSEKGTVNSVPVDDNLKKVMSPFDLGLVAGMGIYAGQHLNGGLRLNYGVSNIYHPEVPANSNIKYPSIANRVLHFYIAYSFHKNENTQ